MDAQSRMVKRLKNADERIEDLLKQMTLEEKAAMVHGNTMFTSAGVPRLGIPDLTMSDGPHGVREEVNPGNWAPAGRDDDYATYLPVGTALAATWNPVMGRLFGEVLGAEARARDKDMILGPGINIVRTPLCGRNFEYYGEDPYHIAKMVVPEIEGIQSQDTAACVKHYAVNNQELNRFRVDTIVDERTMQEIYLPGFESAITKAGSLTLMGAYNKFRGQHCCHNKYLMMDILKKRWEFKGLVVSDWNGVHDTDEAAVNGMDVEMGTRIEGKLDYYLGEERYLKGLREGKYSEADLDDKVRRILRVMIAIGKLDDDRQAGAFNTPEHRQAARTIAAEAVVLLKNEGNLLPLDRTKIKKIAVIGENADRKQAYGGGSSGIKTEYEVTPLEGLKKLLGDDCEIVYEKGYPEARDSFEPIAAEYLGTADEGSGARGWKARYFKFPGEAVDPVREQVEQNIDVTWDDVPDLPETPNTFFLVQWSTRITPPVSGTYHFVVRSNQAFRIHINGECLCDMWGSDVDEIRSVSVDLEADTPVDVMIEHVKFGGRKFIRAGWVVPGSAAADEKTLTEKAVDAAAAADAVLFFGGLNHRFDAEGHDKPDMRLPDGQDGLLEKIVAVNPRTAVFLVCGSPVEMPWIDAVPAVVHAWYAGMEAGTVFADIAFGNVNPSGKMPYTLPKKLADTPAATVGEYKADSVTYNEKIMVGYRWYDAKNIEPLFPFGHGLSYTTFGYDTLRITTDGNDGESVAEVAFTVENTGAVAGAETVQLYVSDPECSVERPVRELKGFAKVNLSPGEKKDVRLSLTRRDLSFYDVDAADWKMEPGTFTVAIGSSSRDLRLEGSFELQ